MTPLRDIGTHVLLAGLCLWAVGVHYWYRLVDPPMVGALPWLSVGLVGVTLLSLLRAVLRTAWPDATILPVVVRAQRLTDWAVLGFCCLSALVLANGLLATPRVVQQTTIVEIGGTELDLGPRVAYSWATVEDWERPGGTRRLILWETERQRLWGGAPALVAMRQGPLGLRVVGAIERDEARRLRAVLAALPTAAMPWQALALWYVRRGQFEDATATAREYYRVYPRDMGFAIRLATRLAGAERWADVVPVLEPFASQQPNYDVYRYLGYGLTHAHRLADGAAWLKKAMAMAPTEWWPAYALGYAYADAHRYQDAVVMLEQAQALGVRLPDVDAKLRHLRSLVKLYGGNHPSVRGQP